MLRSNLKEALVDDDLWDMPRHRTPTGDPLRELQLSALQEVST